MNVRDLFRDCELESLLTDTEIVFDLDRIRRRNLLEKGQRPE